MGTSYSTVHGTMGVLRNFSRGGQSRHFAYLFQIVGDATQMDIYKKEMFSVTATVAYSVFLVRKLYNEQMLVLVSMDF